MDSQKVSDPGSENPPGLWRHYPHDLVLVCLSCVHTAVILLSVWIWPETGLPGRVGIVLLLTASMFYSIIVIAHLFTHVPWFRSEFLNAAASLLNSINIGQSTQIYRLSHVRNHHRYNNDRQGHDGNTRDRSSTFAGTSDGDHAGPLHYAVRGVAATLSQEVRYRLAAGRLWRVADHEKEVLGVAAKATIKRVHELRQVQLERAALALFLVVALLLRPDWVLFAYLPATVVALALVNVQNYYEHFGACPEDRYANSVSYYGRLYNRLTFNDGYHQEHHLSPGEHWSRMEQVRRRYADGLDLKPRIVSPVPAVLGFLDIRRPRLDRAPPGVSASGFGDPNGRRLMRNG